jgi:hypothetical protein
MLAEMLSEVLLSSKTPLTRFSTPDLPYLPYLL